MSRAHPSEWSDGAAGPLLHDVVVALADLDPSGDALAWQDRALCAEVDRGDMFYPEKGEPTGPPKSVCRRCDVKAECLQFALDNDEPFGVWGGLSEQERSRLRKQAA